jgi:hypothetical protein
MSKPEITDFWYDTPEHPGGRWVLAINIKIDGQATIMFYLTVEEMKAALASFRHEDADEDDTPRHLHTNTVWWAYEAVEADEGFHLGGRQVDKVPVCLYRDDHFLVWLPHECGTRIRDIIEHRLPLTMEKAA